MHANKFAPTRRLFLSRRSPHHTCTAATIPRGLSKWKLEQAVLDAYGDAIPEAARETGLAEEIFPPVCPFTIEQILNGAVPGDGPE